MVLFFQTIFIEASTNDIGDKTEESDEENSMVEAEENKIKKNEELSSKILYSRMI